MDGIFRLHEHLLIQILKSKKKSSYNFQMLNSYCGHGILTYEPGIRLKLYLLGRVQFKKKFKFDHPDSYMYVII